MQKNSRIGGTRAAIYRRDRRKVTRRGETAIERKVDLISVSDTGMPPTVVPRRCARRRCNSVTMQPTRPATVPAEPRRFRTEVLMMGSSRAAVMVLGFAQSVIVARALGPSGRGAVAAAITLALILLQAGTLGLTAANPYFVARDRLLHGRLIGNSVWLALGLGLLLAGLGAMAKVLAPDIVRGVSWLS